MKKHFRLFSALLAACMSLTMVAGAANIAEDEVRTGVAHVAQEDGSVVDIPYEYTVPADATDDEATDIALEAARAAARGGVQTFSAESMTRVFRKTYKESPVKIPKKSSSLSATELSKRLPQDIDEIDVILYDVTGCSTINVSILNDNYPTETVYKVQTAETDTEVFFYNRCVADDGHSILFLDEGDYITARVSGNVDGEASSFKMYGYAY